MKESCDKPIVYDLYAGLFGWGSAFVAEGFRVVGFDIEDMSAALGSPGPDGCELILRDVRSIHGSELKDATCIVGSSPCQEFSYRAMPWKRAKALPPPYLGIELFNAQFRIQREASEAAGHHIPMVVENVRGAQKWVGRAAYHFGSFYIWGDVPALMPQPVKATKHDESGWRPNGTLVSCNRMVPDGQKVPAIPIHPRQDFGWNHSQELQDGRKVGKDWFGGYGGGFEWDSSPMRRNNSKSKARKAASAMIAKIPPPLAQHIARYLAPHPEAL